ncbi:polyadenylate-binding protein-interacting protein 4 isoform X2 [Eutrema salsugineum]|uniref:polyadenylate-binding protein-interacting protein 4 isoform X2 n=1 Tax=Eutrema salsugineum TaxID=72664 RepID=UPI000CED2C60|nr:polyadenylate-binding protein-interacting protein 4 isoform X2 [Eutrema salsugineum]
MNSSLNGSPQKRGEREGVSNKPQPVKSHPANTSNAAFNGKAGSLKKHSRDSLVYLTTCTIGHHVEVHLKNGSVYSGIFHAADVEKNFGIILKMASLIKEGILRGHKSRSEFVRKPPSKTLIIPADELVQVVAKDLSVSSDGMLNAVQSEKPMELLTDSSISQSSHVNHGRVLQRWVPDEDAPQGLENVFDNPWNRGWDQFKANESLFGVKSTFDEELYTTKIERATRTRELEEQAVRIAREIEGENTRDLHVAEERGLQLNEKFDIDEETKYSAVRPVDGFDDSGFDEEEDKLLDTSNDQTFGGSSTSDGQKSASSSGKGYEKIRGDSQPPRKDTNVDQSCSISGEQRSRESPAPGGSISESQLGERRNNSNPEVSPSNRSPEESVSGHGDINEGPKLGGGGATSVTKAVAEREKQVSQVSGKTKPDISSRSSESRPAPSTSSRPRLSPSSSIGSLSSSEKSTLNPNAKEFKLNPNAKSFKPSQSPAPVRPQSPVADASFYYPAGPVQQMPGMPVSYGMQPQYPGQQQQQMMYYHGQQHLQTYYPPGAQPQYPQQQQQQQQQQMMLGQPRPPVVYMPPPHYQPENPYNHGRE